MVSRQQRRQLERLKKKRGKSIVQVFTYTDVDGVKKSLNVESMREWATTNLELVAVDIDITKVEDMLKNERIDKEHVMNVSLQSDPKPILVCDDFVDGQAEIVDGNHTYVAMAIAAAKASEMDINLPGPPRVPAYVFDREIWSRFHV